METISPLFAALGVVEFDALNDLAHWLDGRIEPSRTAARRNLVGGRAAPDPVGSAGRGA